jgi:excisionase family DNA binding protein
MVRRSRSHEETANMSPTKQVLERIAQALEANRPARPIMDIEQAADYIGVHPNTMYRLVESYGLKVYRLTAGGCVRFRRVDLDEWVESRVVTNPSDHKRILRGRCRQDVSTGTAAPQPAACDAERSMS